MRKKLQRQYNDSEIFLETQMKSLWGLTRGNHFSLGQLLQFWSDPQRLATLQQSKFSDDWIGILYQRVSYLIRNKTMLGTEDDKLHQAKTILATAAMLEQQQVSDISGLIKLYQRSQTQKPERCGGDFLEQLEDSFPIFYKGFASLQSKENMAQHVQASGLDVDEDDRAIDLIVINKDERDEMHTYPDTLLSEFIEFYKAMKQLPPKTLLRVKFMGRIIFLSSSGNKTLAELNIAHRNFITVAEVPPPPIPAPPKKERNRATKTKSNKKSSRKKGGKKPQKKGHNSYETKTLDDHKVEHSVRLSQVFEEVETTFKEIRQMLSNLSIKKCSPKDRSIPHKKTRGEVKAESNLSLEGAGGKAGKVVIPIHVGNEECLFVSAKKHKLNRHRTLVVDLHGCSGEEVVRMLNDKLPDWVDTAMKGEHPFIIPVDIVCGGGNQVLNEVVQRWIRQNRQVANRPKR